MPLHHDRRRRVLSDDFLSEATDLDGDTSARVESSPWAMAGTVQPAYASGVDLDRHRRVHELLPMRLATIAATFLVVLVLVVGIESLHLWTRSLSLAFGAEPVQALRVDGDRNLSQWFSSMLLGVAALLAIHIYSLRRHRVDDYHGRYRVWIWAAGGCLLDSLVETTDIARFSREIGRRLDSLLALRQDMLWPCLIGVAIAALSARLLWEVRKSRLSLMALMFCIASFIVGLALDQGWLPLVHEELGSLFSRGGELIGYTCLLVTFLLFSRHVTTEIDSPSSVPVARNKRTRAAAAASDVASKDAPPASTRPVATERSDLEPSQPTVAARSPQGAVSHKIASGVSTALPTSHLSGRPLSRAERRRLRREARAEA